MADNIKKPGGKPAAKKPIKAVVTRGTRPSRSSDSASAGKPNRKTPAATGSAPLKSKRRPAVKRRKPTAPAVPHGSYRYDVCFSFAGENRTYVEQVAKNLKKIAPEIVFFYDNYEADDLWGKDLPTHFDSIYQRDSRFCVMFISKHYERKEWTNLERRSALARTLTNKGKEYILPVYFDDTQLPGVPRSIGDRDARKFTPLQIARTLVNKLERAVAAEGTATPDSPAVPTALLKAKPSPAGDKPKPKASGIPAASNALGYQSRIKTSGNWMLLDGEFYSTKTVTDSGDQIEVHLAPRNNEETARLRDLDPKRGQRHNAVSFAHGEEAAQVDVRAVVAVTVAGKSTLKITLQRQASYSSGYGGGDEAAERQARRLLIGEDQARSTSAGFYTGFSGGFGSLQATFPAVWKRLAGRAATIGDLLRCARLQAVLDLKTGGTVEHVYDLELGPIKKGVLKVKFRGRRHRSYGGEALKDLAFEGTCDLAPSS